MFAPNNRYFCPDHNGNYSDSDTEYSVAAKGKIYQPQNRKQGKKFGKP